MQRVVVIGNSGGGKSLLARQIAERFGLSYVEIDTFLWQQGWRLVPDATYAAEHARLIAGDLWVIDGLGRRESIAARLERATEIVVIDLPLWMHFWLAAERQIALERRRAGASARGNSRNAADESAVQEHLGGGSRLDARNSAVC